VKLVFADREWEDYLHWQAADPNELERLNALIKECARTPFQGMGRPAPLRGDYRGWWSRRLTLEDNLVYRASGSGEAQQLKIAQCRFHY